MTRSAVFNSDSAPLKLFSRTLAQACEMDAEPAVKARKIRHLAAWYRAFAERAANPAIWEARLRTADYLEAEASRIVPEQAACRTEF